jgi:hypothetical protein
MPLGGTEKKKKRGGTEIEWDTSSDDATLLEDSLNIMKKNTEALFDVSEEIGLEVDTNETKYMLSTRILGKILT